MGVIKAIIFDYVGVLYAGGRNNALEAYARQLRKGYKIGLLTSLSSNTLSNYLTQELRSDLFDVVVTADLTDRPKPHPDPYHLVLARLGVTASGAIFIDDNPDNCEAARAIGMRAINYSNVAQLQAEIAGITGVAHA